MHIPGAAVLPFVVGLVEAISEEDDGFKGSAYSFSRDLVPICCEHCSTLCREFCDSKSSTETKQHGGIGGHDCIYNLCTTMQEHTLCRRKRGRELKEYVK